MIKYLSIFYWPLYYLGLVLAERLGVSYLDNVFILPFSIIVCFIGFKKRMFAHLFKNSFMLAWILFFSIAFIHSGINEDWSIVKFILNFILFVTHFTFWYIVALTLNNNVLEKSIFFSANIVFFVFILFQYFQDVGISNLSVNFLKGVNLDNIYGVNSTIDSVLWLSVLVAYILKELYNKINFRNIIFILLYFLIMLGLGKRSLMLGSAILFFLSFFNFSPKYFKFIPLLIVLPLLWSVVAQNLILIIGGNDFFRDVVIRTNEEKFIEASTRIPMYIEAISKLFTFDLEYFFGYKDFPFYIFFEDEKYWNIHNTYLQVFIDHGYILFFLFLYLIIRLFFKISNLNAGFIYNNLFFYIFIFVFVIGNSEAMIRDVKFISLFYYFVFSLFLTDLMKIKKVEIGEY